MTEQMVRYQAPSALMRFQPQTLDEIITMANLFAESGMFPAENGKQTAAQLAVKILAGQELGLTPFAAANGMQIIKGKCTPSANIMAMKVKGSGRYDYRVTEMTDASVSIDFYENGQKVGVSTFTQADANKAGTQNMGKFPRNMLFARAMSNGVKWYAADLFNGVAVYTADEMGATVDYETGEIIDAPTSQPTETVQHRAPATNGVSKPAGKSKEFKRFMAEGTKMFNGQWDDARHWLIERYTRKVTPDNVRTSTNDLSDGEIATLVSALVDKRDYYVAEWAKVVVSQIPTTETADAETDASDTALWADVPVLEDGQSK